MDRTGKEIIENSRVLMKMTGGIRLIVFLEKSILND